MHDAPPRFLHWLLDTRSHDPWEDGPSYHNLSHAGEHRELREDNSGKCNVYKYVRKEIKNNQDFFSSEPDSFRNMVADC